MTEDHPRTQSRSGTAFIIAPFREPFNEYYVRIIKPALADINYEPIRSDEIFSPQAFVQTIWEEILAADLIVAEMTGANANVLYELGLAHAIGKRVVMISQRIDDVPADLRHINCIVYDTSQVDWASTLKRSIQGMALSRSVVRNLMSPVASVENSEMMRALNAELADALGRSEAIRNANVQLERSNARLLLEANEARTALGHELDARDKRRVGRPISRRIRYGSDDTGRDLAYVGLGKSLFQEFVRVPGGRFPYGFGSNVTEEELPEYWVSRYSVTNRQFATFLNACGNRIESGVPWIDLEGNSPADRCYIAYDGKKFTVRDGYDDHPVTYVNFYGASSYCDWIGGELPTSEMWERATRGEDARNYPWGNSPPAPTVANITSDGEWARDVTPIDVHEKRAGASPHGVIQAIGNVRHWTSTYYPDRGAQVVRGGTHFDYRLGSRRVYRFQVSPDGPDLSQGLLPVIRML